MDRVTVPFNKNNDDLSVRCSCISLLFFARIKKTYVFVMSSVGPAAMPAGRVFNVAKKKKKKKPFTTVILLDTVKR